jgi:hypothetical protein
MRYPLDNCASILRHGVLPLLSRGKMGMRKLALLIVLVPATAGGVSAQSACMSADAFSATTQGTLTSIATGTDSTTTATRTLNKIPAATTVSLVTTSTTCQKAVTALNTIFHTTGASRRVYVFAIGSSFIAIDPMLPRGQGGADAEFVFDKKWILQSVRVSE